MRKSKSTMASKQNSPRRLSPAPRTPSGDPVVDLTTRLLTLWDADGGAQTEYYENRGVPEGVQDDTMHSFSEWRDAIETIISFTQANNLQGALVQLALACDAARDVDDATSGDLKTNRKVIKLMRLMHSAMKALRTAIPEIHPDVVSVLKIYGGDFDDRSPAWIDQVPEWAEKGSAERASEGG